jgi:hypothetical protein
MRTTKQNVEVQTCMRGRVVVHPSVAAGVLSCRHGRCLLLGPREETAMLSAGTTSDGVVRPQLLPMSSNTTPTGSKDSPCS